MALAMEAIRLSVVNAGLLGLIGAPTYTMLRDVTQRALVEVLETNEIPYTFHKQENLLELTDMGSEIIFRSMDNPERLVGTNLAWFGVDELTFCQEEAWLRLEARLRHPLAVELAGFGVWTPNGFDWVYRKFIEARDSQYEVILARPRENTYLPGDFYDRLKSSYDSKFFAQEVLGEYLNVSSGRAYHAFAEESIRRVDYAPELPLLWALDFNVDPMSAVLAQDAGGELRVIDEISLRDSNTLEACEAFAQRTAGLPRPLVVKLYGDAAGGARRTTAAKSDYELIREFFRSRPEYRVDFNVPRANPAVRDRVNAVNAMLMSADGRRRLFVDPKCRELIADLRQVSWKEGAAVDLDKRTDPRRTHMSDALGYLVHREYPVTAFRRVITTN